MRKKILILQKIYEELIKYKSGTNQHTFIDSDNPNVIIKKPKKNELFLKDELEMYDFMNKYPSVFIKTYDISVKEVKQEKIDDTKFIEDLKKLKNTLKSNGYLASWKQKLNEETELNFVIDDIRFDDYDLKSAAVKLTGFLFEFYKKLKIFLDKIEKIEEVSPAPFDIHAFQLGYDKMGDIKCFDI